jgi:predicted lipid-binding transport protein (Tim44 family)
MSDLPHYFDIILFAMVAAFLVLRLRSVLGRRTGNERRREYLRGPAVASDKVVPLGQRVTPTPPVASAVQGGEAPGTIAAGLAQISAVDSGFDSAGFIEGARAAFDWILGAFAAGDKAKLRTLLSDDVYKPFAEAIDERVAAGETLETRIGSVKDIDIAEAGIDDSSARITLKIVSEQVHVLRAHDGSVVDGDPNKSVEKTDFWTFARDPRSSDPNWLLVATGSG